MERLRNIPNNIAEARRQKIEQYSLDLASVVTALIEEPPLYSPSGATEWLRQPNKLLGEVSPIEAIDLGFTSDVLTIIHAIKDGSVL